MEILSEPAIFYKIAQLKLNIILDNRNYSYIIYTNRVFIEGLAKSIQAFTIKAPAPLSAYVKTVVSDKLREFNFIEESKLLEKGRKRIEIGEVENGLMDLRVAMERFFFNLVQNKTNLELAPQDKIKANIEKLEKVGYLDGEIKGFLVAISERLLSNQPAHKRELVMEQYSLFEARLFFNLVEDIFDYFIEKNY